MYNACVAGGAADCQVEFDLSHVLTPTLLGALVALGVLALVPVVARRVFGRKLGAGAALQTIMIDTLQDIARRGF